MPRSEVQARPNPGRHPEPPGRKSGSESIPEPHPQNPDPRQVPRKDSRGEEPAGESGRGVPEKRGGKV